MTRGAHSQRASFRMTPLFISTLNSHPPNPAIILNNSSPYSVAAREKMSSPRISHTTNSHNNTQFSNNADSFNITGSFNKTVNIGVTDERSEILAWLSSLEPCTRHQDVQTRRADNVGEWLLQTGEFQRWCDGARHGESDHQILFCCGGPGVGKTYLR